MTNDPINRLALSGIDHAALVDDLLDAKKALTETTVEDRTREVIAELREPITCERGSRYIRYLLSLEAADLLDLFVRKTNRRACKIDRLLAENKALRRALEMCLMNDKTEYEHHEKRPFDGAAPESVGGSIWRTPCEIAGAALFDKTEPAAVRRAMLTAAQKEG